ncbi:MAG: DNA translocase FtsK, partial [Butyrivibrio sp.]|nr:DNA translocase FtsK [Butyrivibrio sp.]
MAGSIILILVLGVICLVIFTERSLVGGLAHGGRRFLDRASSEAEDLHERMQQRSAEDAERRKYIREERREQARQRRDERREREEERRELARQEAERRELEEEQREDARILRMERKVSGVMLNTQLREDEEPTYPEELDELPEEEITEGTQIADAEETSNVRRTIFIPEGDISDDMHEIRYVGSSQEEDETEVMVEPEPVEENSWPVVQSYEEAEDFIPDYVSSQRSKKATVQQEPHETEPELPVIEPEPFSLEPEATVQQEPHETEPALPVIEPEPVSAEPETPVVESEPVETGKVRAVLADVPVHSETAGEEHHTAADYTEEGYRLHTTDYIGAETKEDSAQEQAAVSVRNPVQKDTPGKLPVAPHPYIYPPTDLLKKGRSAKGDSATALRETAAKLQETLETFNVHAAVTDISQGPSVTRYELQPEAGVKVRKIVDLADDIKMHLAATDIRIEAPIPGKSAVGIEVPNKENTPVALRELIESDEFRNAESHLSVAIGKDIAGKIVVTDIGKMPHLLIAGATGSGKSVCINSIIMSILFRAKPEEVKLLLVDPKVVELGVYNGLPHLAIPVVSDPKKAAGALGWAVTEML